MSTEFTLTRRDFVKVGGVLFVSVSLPAAIVDSPVEAAGTLDATQLKSWLEIHADGTILARTGKTETGTSMSAFYAQVIAEELDVPATSVSLVMGHTDETPDGGWSASFLGGAGNLRKVAAYTRQALLGLAATKLGVPAADLAVVNGVVSGGGKSVSYGALVKGQQLDLKIPVAGSLPRIDPNDLIGITGIMGLTVTGNPPTKPIVQYTEIGKSHPRPGIHDIVIGKGVYSSDIRLPGMLHARMVRPPTIGSRLISTDKLDRTKFPTAEVVVYGNLVAVVSPNEWEAVQAALAVARNTQWAPASSTLPGSDHVIRALHGATWTPAGKRGDATKVDAALAGAAKVISATYEQAYVRHAPIGGFVALADVKADGSVTIYSQTSQSQGARANLANTLGVPIEQVTIRCAQGPGQYGRTTFGGDGAMADAAILSKRLGKPVRVQWTLPEDLAWSSVSPAWYADVKAGLDARGNLVALKSDWYSPHENDARMLGAILAGMPTLSPRPGSQYGAVQSVWPYDTVPAFEQVFFTDNLGENATTGGLRGNIMRTPKQRQQNTALEAMITEAAAAAGADPIEFRIRHTTNHAYIGVLKDVARASGWTPRPSPNPNGSRTGTREVTGRGVGVVIRHGSPWVTVAEVAVTPSTGVVRLVNLTVGVDVGKVLNPRHLTSMLQGGAVMGIGEALFEEVTFDTQKVTSTDWSRYRIPRMQDIPEIKTVFTSRNDRGINGGGEAANAATPPAIMAAFFDATGVMPRRIPLQSTYVKSLLAEVEASA
jgi:nicotinate dehydrogenase subunit B